MNPLISPNWHVIFLHAPLGLLAMGLLIELGSFMWMRSAARAAGRWMLLLGILSCVPTVTSGLFAFRQTVNASLNLSQTWPQVKAEAAASGSTAPNLAEVSTSRLTTMWHAGQWAQMREHILWESIGTGSLAVIMIVFLGASDLWRKRLYFPLLILTLMAFATLVSGAWHSGEAVYQYGTAVRGPHPAKLDTATLTDLHTRLQLHAVSAGWVVALGLLALGLSIRAVNEGPAVVSDDVFLETGRERMIDDDTAVDSHGNPVAPVEIDPFTERPLPGVIGISPLPISTSRWWLLTALFAVGTVVGGLWVVGVWDWPHLRTMLEKKDRILWHTIFGTSILVLALILALTTRVARKNKWVLSFFSLLMVIALAGQVWLGVLMMYDSPKGPDPQFWKFNTAPAAVAAQQP